MPQNANGSATSASTTCIRRLLLWTQSNGDMTRVSENLAERTGLEPATPGVTGRYSNQLNYRSAFALPRVERRSASVPTRGGNPAPPASGITNRWVLTGSNRRHSPCRGDALPAELSTPSQETGATAFRRARSGSGRGASLLHPSGPCQRGTWELWRL